MFYNVNVFYNKKVIEVEFSEIAFYNQNMNSTNTICMVALIRLSVCVEENRQSIMLLRVSNLYSGDGE